MRVNTELLDKKIDESGLKVSFLIEKLGISHNGFYKKKNGEIPFRASEVYVLCDLLKISDEAEKKLIFMP